MTDKDLSSVQQHPDFVRLVQRKQRLTWTLTIAILAIYFGFVLTMAFAPGVLAITLGGGVTSLGIPVVITAIVLSFILTAVYVQQSNKNIDPLNKKLLEEYYQ